MRSICSIGISFINFLPISKKKKKRQAKGRKSPDFQPNALPCEDGVCRRDMLPPVWGKKLQMSTRHSRLVNVEENFPRIFLNRPQMPQSHLYCPVEEYL